MDMMEIMRNKQQVRINTIATFVAMWDLYTKTKDENLLDILEKAVDDFIEKEYK
jgi:rhamnogalacturonyl hydrolase YesR